MNKLSQKFHGLKILFKFDNTAQLLLNRLFFPCGGPNIYHLDGLEILVDHSAGDQDGTRSCLIPGLYDPCFEVLDNLPQSLSVLDLGANGGGFLLALKHSGREIRRAVAVELNPHTYSRLALNIQRNIPNNHDHVFAINGAAGGTDGELRVNLGRGSVGDSVNGSSTGGEEYHLPCFSFLTLAGHFPENEDIDICKIDIEGAEYSLLENAPIALLRRCKYIIIEIHEISKKSPENLIFLIMSAGFRKVETLRPLLETTVFLFCRLD